MFFNFGIIDIIDIFCVALLLFYIYKLMKNSRSLNIFVGIIFFVVFWLLVSHVLEMRLLSTILDKFISVGLIALIIIFQKELRSFFYNIGSHQRNGFLKFFIKNNENDSANANANAIIMACDNMAKQKVGALIVIEKNHHLDDIVATGETINADISQRLIENIFFKNSPLHDGAMIISKHRIMAAGCILPLAHDVEIPAQFGLRHRAAMGMSQNSDAVIIVVSEETGRITLAVNGEFIHNLNAEQLENYL